MGYLRRDRHWCRFYRYRYAVGRELQKGRTHGSAQVSLNTSGTGEHGTMMSGGGWFTNVALEHADWIVDPGLMERDNMICIHGWYEHGDDEYHYEIYLRPWGLYWDDAGEDFLPLILTRTGTCQ